MGQIATTGNGQEQLDTFLTRVTAAQTSLIQAINANEPLRASFAEAEAKLILLEQITPDVGAYLLRFCDKSINMVEVVNTTDKDRMVKCVALAILNGFVPGKEQFGIHTNQLYVKENGYRKLFSNLHDCGPPDVQAGHPDQADLGNGKKVWRVDGVASVMLRGTEYRVECLKEFAIGIPANNSDQIDGIKTKARRRLLQLLWKKVSSIGLEDSEDEFETTQQSQPSPAKIEVVPPATTKPIDEQEAKDAAIRRTVSRKGKQEQGQTILRSSPGQVAEFDSIWNEITGIATLRELDQIGEALKQPDIPYASFSKDAKGLVKWLWADKKKELEATVAP